MEAWRLKRRVPHSNLGICSAPFRHGQVVVFSKAYCPFCTSTKQLLEQLKIDAKVYELDQMEDGAAIQGALLDISGQRTVPK